VAIIGQANNPMCFRGEGNDCPLPPFNQKRAWMDKHFYERRWNTFFLPAVHERHRGLKCALIMDNASTHNVNMSAEDVEIFFFSPNSTAVYQSMDAGASLKRRYKRRLLAVLVWSSPVPLVPPYPPPPPASLPAPPAEPLSVTPLTPPHSAPTTPPHGRSWLS